MKILILSAMSKELELLKNIVKKVHSHKEDDIEIFEGYIDDKIIFLAQCGIGKVNSALTTYKLIKDLAPDIVINSGVAGGAGSPIGSVLVPDKISYHDVWCGPGTVTGQVSGLPLFFSPDKRVIEISKKLNNKERIINGLICSGDKFISRKEEVDQIRKDFPEVKAIDMESASIAHTCFKLHIPFAIIRVVSDTPGEGENVSQYENFWNDAPIKTFETVRAIIKDL